MIIPSYVKEASKIIGYFCYTDSGNVICDGDACIIAGSEELMRFYLERLPRSDEREIIKKTRFSEIANGLKQGGAYAFDEESYGRFLDCAKTNGMNELPAKKEFFAEAVAEMHFIRIQFSAC